MAAPGAAFADQPGRPAGTITPLLTREASRRPPDGTLRAALYGHAFNPRRRSGALDPVTASALAWLERACLPAS
jgi:hypothetical protein